MTRKPTRGPVVWTALYVAALVLTWATLFSLERFGEHEVRSWAPLIQAVLSAAAIFSAWWLQSEKRRSDRVADARDAMTAIIAHSGHAEWIAAHVTDVCLHRTIDVVDATAYGRQIRDTEQTLKKVDIGRLPSADAIKALMDMVHSLGVLAGMLEMIGAKAASPTSFRADSYSICYDEFFHARTKFLKLSGERPEKWRRPLATLAETRPKEISVMFPPAEPSKRE